LITHRGRNTTGPQPEGLRFSQTSSELKNNTIATESVAEGLHLFVEDKRKRESEWCLLLGLPLTAMIGYVAYDGLSSDDGPQVSTMAICIVVSLVWASVMLRVLTKRDQQRRENRALAAQSRDSLPTYT